METIPIYELRRGDRFTVPDLPGMLVLTFDQMDGMYAEALTDDGQFVRIAGGVACVRVGGGDE